jgi:hypothetical protein
VTRVLPVALVALTALITTVIVQTVYGVLYLWQYLFEAATRPYDWAGSLCVSGAATAVVLIAGLVARRLTMRITDRQPAGLAAAIRTVEQYRDAANR